MYKTYQGHQGTYQGLQWSYQGQPGTNQGHPGTEQGQPGTVGIIGKIPKTNGEYFDHFNKKIVSLKNNRLFEHNIG